MTTLENLIKQFVAIADDEDERRKRLELMTTQIAKLKANTPDDDGGDAKPIIVIDPWSDRDG